MSDERGVVPSQAVLARTALRIRRHPCNRLKAIAANPHSHTPANDSAIQSGPAVAVAMTPVWGDNAANGALKSRTPADATTDLIRAGACRHSTNPPAAANSANGTRNLIDAASQ